MPAPHDQESDDDLAIREDQRKAMEELDRIQSTSPEEWTDEMDQKFYNYLVTEPPPDYNEVRSRLAELNAELESDPAPAEVKRERKVMFPENPVQSEIPPEDEESSPTAEDSDDVDSSSEVTEEQPNQRKEGEGTHSESNGHGKVLIERNGKYAYVDKDDVEANQVDLSSDEESGDEEPKRTRPSSSISPGRSKQHPAAKESRTRPPSAPQLSNGTNNNSKSNRYTYRLPPDYFKKVEEKKRRDEETKKRKEQERKELEEKRRKENEEAFQSWLRHKEENKNKDSERKKREEEEAEERRRDEEEEQRRQRPTFEDWQRQKKQQSKSERRLLRKEFEELQSNSGRHSPEDCRRAFKQWLKKKEDQKKEEQKIERYRARITRLALRRSRKSQALANALAAANSYRYMEYYGYR